MADEDWYRNEKWNKRIKEAFFAKLNRARSQRDQYLVIQAHYLEKHYPEITLELIELYFATRKDKFDDVRAYWAQASAYKTMKQYEQMIQAYKKVFRRETEFPRHTTSAYVEFPYLVASKKIFSEYDFALDILSKRAEDCKFPLSFYKWNAAHALIAFDQGRTDDALMYAKKAIEFAEVKKSWFRYHPNSGLVGKEHKLVIKQLLKIL